MNPPVVREPPVWYVQCDEPDCDALVGGSGLTDRRAIEAALDEAVFHGWFIASDRFVRSRMDLCPKHRARVEADITLSVRKRWGAG